MRGCRSVSNFLEIYPAKADIFECLHMIHTDIEENLIDIWALDKLQEEHRDTFALLSRIAMLNPECIEHDLLKPRQTNSNTASLDMPPAQYIAHRTRLADASLIDVDSDTQDVRVHRIVQDVTIDMIARRGSYLPDFRGAVQTVADRWPFLNRDYVSGTATNMDRWEACKQAYTHIIRLMEVYRVFSRYAKQSLAVPELAELLLEAAQYQLECSLDDNVVALLDTAQSIYECTSHDSAKTDENLVKVYRGRIGLASSSKNADELLKFAQLAWKIETNKFRRTRQQTPFLAVAHNDLAVGWACQREWERAIALSEESKAVRERMPGFTRDKLFSPLYHLGLVFLHQGRFSEAEEVLNQAIRDREEVFGANDAKSTRSAALLYARGNVKFNRADPGLNDLRESLKDHNEAMSRATRTTGAQSRPALLCQYQVAKVHMALGEHETACDLLKDVLARIIDRPTYHRDIAQNSYLYAKCLRLRGNVVQSEQELSRAVELHNSLRPLQQRTTSNLTDGDIAELIPYDYL
ncbi:MAG: hypothetical protein Q9162_002572 [Coniocarpon cinnabarinum]